MQSVQFSICIDGKFCMQVAITFCQFQAINIRLTMSTLSIPTEWSRTNNHSDQKTRGRFFLYSSMSCIKHRYCICFTHHLSFTHDDKRRPISRKEKKPSRWLVIVCMCVSSNLQRNLIFQHTNLPYPRTFLAVLNVLQRVMCQ